jgi:hypothetical protein
VRRAGASCELRELELPAGLAAVDCVGEMVVGCLKGHLDLRSPDRAGTYLLDGHTTPRRGGNGGSGDHPTATTNVQRHS